MSEIPYDPDFADMISSAIISDDYEMARYLLASGSFGDSLNHAYKTELEGVAREFLYGYDRSNELNIKANLLKGYSNNVDGASPRGSWRTGSSRVSWRRPGRTTRPRGRLERPSPLLGEGTHTGEGGGGPLRLQSSGRTWKTASRSRSSACTRRTSTTCAT